MGMDFILTKKNVIHVIKGCEGAVAREISACMLKILYLALNSDF